MELMKNYLQPMGAIFKKKTTLKKQFTDVSGPSV
jgi:hypothetical protein